MIKKPTLAIYTSTATDSTPPVFNDDYYAKAYAELFRNLIKLGAIPIVTYDAEKTYFKDGIFKQSWLVQEQDGKISYVKTNEPVKVNLLYDKNRFPFSDLPKINPDRIKSICNDKYLSYLFAPDMHASCYLIESLDQLDALRLSHQRTKIALKELDSFGGSKVFVGEMKNYKNYLSFPLLAQEFIDTSSGFANLASGIHDIRVAIFNGKVIHGLIRWPSKKGEFRTNLSLGGKVRALFICEIPEKLISLSKELDKRFDIPSPRFFSADFGYDGSRWKLFELNNMPGLAHESEDGPAANEFLQLLAEKLIESV
jgi:glutathione synthase/RimK-type ligase-like ATP-grasp enzyme